jgi:divalent metal cation (Fe/Co/Zn/Cd) transporter
MRYPDIARRVGVILQIVGGIGIIAGVWEWLGVAAALIIGGIILALAGSVIELAQELDDDQHDDDYESEGS